MSSYGGHDFGRAAQGVMIRAMAQRNLWHTRVAATAREVNRKSPFAAV